MTTTTRPARLPLTQERPLIQRESASPSSQDDGVIVLGNLTVDVEGFHAEVDDTTVTLTAQEFELLVALARRAGRLVSQQALADALWQGPKRGYGRHLGVVVSRLRAKLAAAYPYRIETVRSRGFVIKPAQF